MLGELIEIILHTPKNIGNIFLAVLLTAYNVTWIDDLTNQLFFTEKKTQLTSLLKKSLKKGIIAKK